MSVFSVPFCFVLNNDIETQRKDVWIPKFRSAPFRSILFCSVLDNDIETQGKDVWIGKAEKTMLLVLCL